MGSNYDQTHIALRFLKEMGKITFAINGKIICAPVEMQNTSADGNIMA
jgi:hypothetical protein